MSRKGILCPTHGIIPKPGSNPSCRDCRLLLDLPAIDGGRGSPHAASLLARIARFKAGQSANTTGTQCGGVTADGRRCAHTSRAGKPFCRWHAPAIVTAHPLATPTTVPDAVVA